MQIIPAINEIKFSEIKKKLKLATDFSDWIQIDITDGKFTLNKTWNNSNELKDFLKKEKSKISNLKIEIHLMIDQPEKQIQKWISAGAKRIILHLEALQNFHPIKQNNKKNHQTINSIFSNKNCEIGLAINPETSVEELIPYLDQIKKCQFIQILAVKPGLAGQKFQSKMLNKIKFLKKRHPKIIIEIDGGINLKTAKLCKKAKADILVSASYIWQNKNPQKAYQLLSKI